jgi:hypothetical protein
VVEDLALATGELAVGMLTDPLGTVDSLATPILEQIRAGDFYSAPYCRPTESEAMRDVPAAVAAAVGRGGAVEVCVAPSRRPRRHRSAGVVMPVPATTHKAELVVDLPRLRSNRHPPRACEPTSTNLPTTTTFLSLLFRGVSSFRLRGHRSRARAPRRRISAARTLRSGRSRRCSPAGLRYPYSWYITMYKFVPPQVGRS